jgi:hypothetical protein
VREVQAWNMTACIDEGRNLFVWGTLTSEKGMSIIIEEPEQIPNIKMAMVDVGRAIIAGIEHGTNRFRWINCNDSSLENTAFFNQFQFNEEVDIKDKQIERFSLGKSDFVVAISQIQQASDILQSTGVQFN